MPYSLPVFNTRLVTCSALGQMPSRLCPSLHNYSACWSVQAQFMPSVSHSSTLFEWHIVPSASPFPAPVGPCGFCLSSLLYGLCSLSPYLYPSAIISDRKSTFSFSASCCPSAVEILRICTRSILFATSSIG